MSVFRGKAEVARTRPNRRFDPKRSSRGCAARYSKINVPRGASESPGAVSVVNRCQPSRLRSTVTEQAHLEMGRDGEKTHHDFTQCSLRHVPTSRPRRQRLG